MVLQERGFIQILWKEILVMTRSNTLRVGDWGKSEGQSLEWRKPRKGEARLSEGSSIIRWSLTSSGIMLSLVEENDDSKLTNDSKFTNSTFKQWRKGTQDICKGLQLRGVLGGIVRWPKTQSWGISGRSKGKWTSSRARKICTIYLYAQRWKKYEREIRYSMRMLKRRTALNRKSEFLYNKKGKRINL